MRILNIYFSKTLGGIEQAFVDYADALCRRSHEVHCVIHPRCPFKSALRNVGAEIHEINNSGHFDPIALAKLRLLAHRLRPDAALGHNGRAYNALKYSLSRRITRVAVLHNMNVKRAIGLDHFFCVNHRIRARLREAGIGDDMIDFVPNMIDVDPALPPARLPRLRSPVVLGALGRFTMEKGFDVLLDALALLRRRAPNLSWKLRLAGSGPAEEILRNRIADLDLGGHVELCGWITDKSGFFGSVDIFILPSISESFGIVILEAWKHAVPVIATSCDGPSEIVDNGNNGWLVQPNSPAALAGAIESAMRNPEETLKLGHNGFEISCHRYAKSQIASRLDTVLCRLVAARLAATP